MTGVGDTHGPNGLATDGPFFNRPSQRSQASVAAVDPDDERPVAGRQGPRRDQDKRAASVAGQSRCWDPNQGVVEDPVWMVPDNGEDRVRRGGLKLQFGEGRPSPRLETHGDPAGASDSSERLVEQHRGPCSR